MSYRRDLQEVVRTATVQVSPPCITRRAQAYMAKACRHSLRAARGGSAISTLLLLLFPCASAQHLRAGAGHDPQTRPRGIAAAYYPGCVRGAGGGGT